MKISLIAMIVSMFIFQGCDNLDDDQLPAKEITDFDSESFLTVGSMAIIDVSGGIEHGKPVNLNIALPPRLGRLENFKGGLLKYLPNSSFSKGQDFFNVEIKSEQNELLAIKTVKITVNPDSADLPCTLIAFADFASINVGDSVLIDVLQNDWDCPEVPKDSTSLTLTSQPGNGEAAVINGKVQYIPNPTFSGIDEFVYSVSSIDEEVVSHALVQINVGNDSTGNCNVHLQDDQIYLPHGVDSMYIPALDNDILCDLSIQSVSTSQQPQYGVVTIVQSDSANWHFLYQLTQPDASGSDQFTYKICDNTNCYEAVVSIDLNPCSLRANDDNFVLDADSLSQSDTIDLAILNNDDYCSTDSLQLHIVSEPSNGTATVGNRRLIYTSDSVNQYADSLVYKICQGTTLCDSAKVLINFQ